MKRAIILMFTVSLLGITAPSFADLPEPIHKLKGGAMDILSVPYDIGKRTYDEVTVSTFKPFGLVGGLIKGTAFGLKKAVSGAIDVVTFPIDLNK